MNPALYLSIKPFRRNSPTDTHPRRKVFLPKEHGSWSLALEPIFFGLLIVPSHAGAALGLSAAAAFFIRRPMKAVFNAYHHTALLALILFSAAALFGLFQVVMLSGFAPLWPLLPAIPMGMLYLYWDRQNEGRAAAAELMGSSMFALIPAVMATLAGQSAIFALSLTAIMLARSIPTILTVRTWLRQRKGQTVNCVPAVTATIIAVALMTYLTREGHTPLIVHALVLISSLRLALLFTHTPRWSAKHIGMAEAVFGLIYLILIALGYH